MREALWLRSPRSPRSGRVGGRIWLILIPLIVGVGAVQALIPTFGALGPRPLHAGRVGRGKAFLDGAWGWYGLLLVMFLFNTVLGEEPCFAGTCSHG